MEQPLPAIILLLILLGGLLCIAGCLKEAPGPVSAPLPAAPSVTLATDRIRYSHGEMVTLNMTNGFDYPVWYISYPQRDLVFWELETIRNASWQRLDVRLPLVEEGREVCRIVLYERPVGAVAELKPHADLRYEWNQKVCTDKALTGPSGPETIGPGRYRFALRYSQDTVRAEDPGTEPWKRPVDLGGTTTGYSNEFVVA